MCGFAGVMVSDGGRFPDLGGLVEGLARTLHHRGPDDSGAWVHPGGQLAFGFRRLSIVELSPLGHQPMSSTSGRFTLVFNGEVYNYRELRAELSRAGKVFRGGSDTEVILAAFEEWGIHGAVERFVGMFAMAVWDEKTECPSLLRDRLGIKPLFVYRGSGIVAFASELKALVEIPGFDREVDLESLTTYLRYLYVPAPGTIYTHVRKLLPGHLIQFRDPQDPVESQAYWDVGEVMRRGLENRFQGSAEEAADALEDLLGQAVSTRLHADVPVGAFLSAGVDSSTVVSFMQEYSSRPVQTFSIAFDEARHNEADVAAKIAQHIGTDHTELMLTGKEALEVVPKLPEMFDEPHADTSQVPQYLLCSKARDVVTVALSGDGGDEIFGGYHRYIDGPPLIERISRIPGTIRMPASRAIQFLSPDSWDRLFGMWRLVTPRSRERRLPGEKTHKLARLMSERTKAGMFRSLLSAWPDPAALVPRGREVTGVLEDVVGSDLGTLMDRMMLSDQRTYLADDQLAKVDRVSMAVSLEVRVPLIDHRLVEFSWTLPQEMKTRDGVGKWLLREVLYRRVPRTLVERPKMGLSVPLDRWLRGPLRDWAEDLLDPARIDAVGILDAREVRRTWDALLRGRGETALGLWAVLMFQAWGRRWIGL